MIRVLVHGITGVYQNCLLSEIFQVFYLVENAVAFFFLTLFESCIKIGFLVLCIGIVLSFLSFFYILILMP